MATRRFVMGVCALALGAGCGGTHLGDHFGRRNRNVYDVQAEGTSTSTAGVLDAEDAKVAYARHHAATAAQPGSASAFGGGGGATPGAATSSGQPTMQLSSGAATPIKLDAK